MGRDIREMMADALTDEYDPTFTRFIAEALIARDGPQEITTRADELGLSPVAKDVAVAACAATACDCSNIHDRVIYETRR
jgi:hypothetical protein